MGAVSYCLDYVYRLHGIQIAACMWPPRVVSGHVPMENFEVKDYWQLNFFLKVRYAKVEGLCPPYSEKCGLQTYKAII